MESLCERLTQRGIPFLRHCPTAKYSTLRIGGTAALAVFPSNEEQLIAALTEVSESGYPWVTVGKGSNLLFPDGEYNGVLIFTLHVLECRQEGELFHASAGTLLGTVALRARNSALSGGEFMAGIPGTVGGAVFMNAGAFGSSMEAITVSSRYWDPKTKQVCVLEGAEHRFGYRTSVYAEHPERTILSVTLRMKEGNIDEIDGRMADYARKRSSTQPLKEHNAGSTFKHPEGYFAGKLIEDCGLKGAQVRGAMVSTKHAGFLVNRSGATAQDMITLIRFVRQRVYDAYGVELECELRAVGIDLNRLPISK